MSKKTRGKLLDYAIYFTNMITFCMEFFLRGIFSEMLLTRYLLKETHSKCPEHSIRSKKEQFPELIRI